MRKRQQRPERRRKRKKTSGIGVFPPDEALLTADETCNVLKISRRTLWSWSNGRRPILPPVKIGGLPRWTVADVQRLIRERKIAA
jgi:predicted DNA-binding transcriptional regulator AlpA